MSSPSGWLPRGRAARRDLPHGSTYAATALRLTVRTQSSRRSRTPGRTARPRPSASALAQRMVVVMETTAGGHSDVLAQPRRVLLPLDPPAAAAWTLAFALVAYLALSNGGYDTVVRSQAGIAVWWVVLLGALAGILPARLGRASWVAIGLLAAFAVWTGLAATWSESAERSAVELGRVATYLGVLVLAIAVQGRTAARHTINGVAARSAS